MVGVKRACQDLSIPRSEIYRRRSAGFLRACGRAAVFSPPFERRREIGRPGLPA